MKTERIAIFLLILLIVAGGMTVVTARYNADSIDVVKNSTAQIYYSEPQKSTDYAYYYENSGNFAEDAYWGPWSVDVTVDLDVEEMYHKLTYAQKQNYTLDDFKQDLAILVENDGIKLSGIDFEESLRSCKAVSIPNYNETEMTCSLDENSTTLTVSFSYAPEEYGTKDRIDDLNTLKNTKEMGFTIDFEDIPDAGLKNDQINEDIFFVHDIPVKTELSS